MKESGITLLELMLVLVIGVAFILLGFQQYQLMQRDATNQQIMQTVNGLFQGAKHYYYANCRISSSNPNATLDPATSGFSLTLQVSPLVLSTQGFLDMRWPPPQNDIVDVNYGVNGYGIQFVISSTSGTPRSNPRGVYYNWSTTPPTTVTFSQQVGTIYTWQIDVIVKLDDSVNASTYQAVLGATCTTSNPSDRGCSNVTSPGQYLIWERLPSFGGKETLTTSWLTMSRIKQFKNLYTNDDMYGASNSTFATDRAIPSTQQLGNDYLCGE